MPTKDEGTATNANANATVQKLTDVEKSSSSSTEFTWGVFRQELGSYMIFSTILLPVAVGPWKNSA